MYEHTPGLALPYIMDGSHSDWCTLLALAYVVCQVYLTTHLDTTLRLPGTHVSQIITIAFAVDLAN